MVSIAEAERIRAERLSESRGRTRAAETRKRCSVAAAAAGVAQAAAERFEHWPMISHVKP